MAERTITRPRHTVHVGAKVAATSRFTLYRARSDIRPNKECLLQVAATTDANASIDRAGFLLKIMGDEAARLEAEFAGGPSGTQSLSYDYLVPEALDSWPEPQAENRRALLLAFRTVTANGYLPMLHFAKRERVRVDPRTSAWVLGKLLKLLTFTHPLGIEIGNLSPANILIEPKEHFVLMLDWTQAQQQNGAVEADVARREIAALAKNVTALLGGNVSTGALPEDPWLADERYALFIHRLVGGAYEDAFAAHSDFYKLIRELWKSEYYPWTTYTLEGE